jgi:hypothetical protein
MTRTSWIRAGRITEIVGELSSGRTSLMTACLRDVTAAGGTAALVDADGAFDPASAARTGVVLSRLLWVRCGGRRDAALAATDLLARCPGFAHAARRADVGRLAARPDAAGGHEHAPSSNPQPGCVLAAVRDAGRAAVVDGIAQGGRPRGGPGT